MAREYEAQLLYQPPTDALRFLPEGPYPLDQQRMSWVGIQHGGDAQIGSLNVLDFASGENRSYELEGRPGFAYATDREGVFVVGLERNVRLFDTNSGQYEDLCGPIDQDVENTIINDGLAFDGGLLFGAKDLEFAEKKAGLYLWRRSDRQLIRLRSDQICSNGKVLLQQDGKTVLLDIDSPTKTVVAYDLDVQQGTLSEAKIVVDLRDGDSFPDGMIATPDGQSVIISFYNPNDAEAGETRQYGLQQGDLQCVWKTPKAPQATCPQLVKYQGRVKLVITTAVEHMSVERRAQHVNSGCLFWADTDFAELPDTPIFRIDSE